MQALPIYLDKLFNQYVAIILSVTFVLFFGEVCYLNSWAVSYIRLLVSSYLILNSLEFDFFFFFDPFICKVIPQAICTRYGLAVGANFVWLVRILMIICYPIAYPIGKVKI